MFVNIVSNSFSCKYEARDPQPEDPSSESEKYVNCKYEARDPRPEDLSSESEKPRTPLRAFTYKHSNDDMHDDGIR